MEAQDRMWSAFRRGGVALAVVLTLGAPFARAADPAPAATAAPAVEPVEVPGFRSARFGMTEAALRTAIAKDFPAQVKALTSEQNQVEKTSALALAVDDLIPDSGPSLVSYILGYKSKALIQVNISWGARVGAPAKPETLVNTANQLALYLREAGYRPGSIITDSVAADGSLVVFRGEDAKGHITLLVLRGRTEKADKETRFVPTLLQLSYIADPRNPDIFRLEKGKF